MRSRPATPWPGWVTYLDRRHPVPDAFPGRAERVDASGTLLILDRSVDEVSEEDVAQAKAVLERAGSPEPLHP